MHKCMHITSHMFGFQWAEVHEGMTVSTARALIGSHGTVTRDTHKSFLVTLTPQELTQFLPGLPLLNDAEFTGPVWTFGGQKRRKTMREMAFEKAEVKYTKSIKLLTLRIRLWRGY